MNMTVSMILGALIGFAVTVLLCKIFIPVLRKVKLGQKILEIGPSWHKCKEGTPTMGGVFFIVAIIIAACALVLPDCIKTNNWAIMVHLGFALFNGLIGLVDDYVKLFKKRNKGLTAIQKLILQFGSAGVYLFAVDKLVGINTTVFGINLSFFYYIILLVAIVYFVNCSNLTDGIDGLEGSISAVICLALMLLAIRLKDTSLAVISATSVGALLGYLIFNFHPAKVFMGDTGSLFLGGLATALLVHIGSPLLIVLMGFVWLFEGVSVMLQVFSFKVFGKRIFKMTPVHHHFEMCGWSEFTIVGVFSLVTAIGCAIAYFVYFM
ncbi:MAG: phospho-N-acetylmuramoyl-pentapeptide-transferase [Clostridia bacterium]|jgi:phospho-N-acetylmuramoyl-pentapeptide-transferase|nr:phospho-N-acetylmuramoyl-pentapeptide-transferase [Clostridia bacterium]MBO7217046.1 phospho-N-acetylmuramoyl-pentapeptide-transferase [Clostridia bacterium]MBO7245924.1 phospho-N-acetylmuramoyl-pentapeptide-transferase [Clostridia bacterium]MBO7737638.1 phospho-N-acetylmuramoyl-pentapeptide-transferase [Clostridia bacterium]MBQ5842599.1 phospho-N-acetylmuramoyl-pentapeptide-transferase [Clostridia bacterium]